MQDVARASFAVSNLSNQLFLAYAREPFRSVFSSKWVFVTVSFIGESAPPSPWRQTEGAALAAEV